MTCSAIRLPVARSLIAPHVNVAFSSVVESVLKKDEHRLEDRRLPGYYPLKVSRYCEHVSVAVISPAVPPLLP